MTRLEANRQILSILKTLVETYPDWRFGQLMRNADVVDQVPNAGDGSFYVWADEFNLESEALLKRIKASPLVKP